MLHTNTTKDKVLHLLTSDPKRFSLQQQEVAEVFCMSRRTLIQHLENEGTSYRSIVQEAKKEMAAHMLRTTDASIAQIAQALGYTNASNFTRSFKLWYGVPPGQFLMQTVSTSHE